MKTNLMSHSTSKKSRYAPTFLCGLAICIFVTFSVLVLDGCVNSSRSTTKNFPAIKTYIEKKLKFLHEIGFSEVQMQPEPSVDGGNVLMFGSVPDQKTYELLIRFTEDSKFNSDLPAAINWKVQIRKKDPG